ncbi:MAG: hypothetical protein JWN86_4146 [Planctomycetota bacterium]|nr:hypothetical protein [Planctomycetota bacterium]
MPISCRIVRSPVPGLRLLSTYATPSAMLRFDWDLRLVRRMGREESLLTMWERAVR